ncbi:hypothetical protein V1478_013422, partial [Vespula squamosa]
MNLPSGFILRTIQERYMSTLSRRSLNDSTREPIGPKSRESIWLYSDIPAPAATAATAAAARAESRHGLLAAGYLKYSTPFSEQSSHD